MATEYLNRTVHREDPGLISLSALRTAITEHAAIRRIRRLQPAGGAGDKLFPPTYPAERTTDPPQHVFELRRVADREAWCVLIDSVQSQANRMEEALLAAAKGAAIPLPYILVDFSEADLYPLKQITSLDAPHRVYDAIIRDSLLDDVPFMESTAGRRLAAATPASATALLEISPTALVFGAWHSQGEGGGLGAKFPRVLVSEIMGIDTPVEEVVWDRRTNRTEPQTAGRRTGSRIDPLGVLRRVDVFKNPTGWSTDQKEAGKGAKKVRPSEINHGNITPTVVPLGVTCAYAEHRAVLTLAGLRRLRFEGDERDAAGRALLAALGLLAIAEQDARGYALRSRCDLVCDDVAGLELVHADGATEAIDLDLPGARALYGAAHAAAQQAGFEFRSLTLKPQPKLVEIVRRSRELALEGEGRDDQNE
jgi:CRISPR-associated protein Csb1